MGPGGTLTTKEGLHFQWITSEFSHRKPSVSLFLAVVSVVGNILDQHKTG